jgi:hypothetical protein
MYPFYEKAVKAGITTLSIHKVLLPTFPQLLRVSVETAPEKER